MKTLNPAMGRFVATWWASTLTPLLAIFMVGSACTIDGFLGSSLTGQDEQLSPLLASSIQTPPANWPSNGRTPGEDRFSPLSQITDGNVNELGLAWSGHRRGYVHERLVEHRNRT